MAVRSVAYAYSKEYAKMCDCFEKEPYRASSVHALVHAYGLMDKMSILAPHKATPKQMSQFHSPSYLEFLQRPDSLSVDLEELTKEGEELYGVGYDCPLKPGLYAYTQAVSGATLDCAAALASGRASVAINWGGGWHHGRPAQASGFCYINDCVLAILQLKETYDRILYLDLDAHHGDAVQDAFSTTNKVLCVSLHMHEPGFFPGTGGLEEAGIGRGRDHTLNVPLRSGLNDTQWIRISDLLLPAVWAAFRPQAIVLQCGADGLSRDPVESFNLTPQALVHSLDLVLGWGQPTLILGGGGYHRTNVARCWTQLTARALDLSPPLPDDIPEHPLITQYGPDYCLAMEPGKLPNLNTELELERVLNFCLERLKKISVITNGC